MIISHKYNYLFLANPHTGSTSLSKILCKEYDGKEILHKHASYLLFNKNYSVKKKKYFVFAGVRNPLDEIVSTYIRLNTNFRSTFTNKKFYKKYGGWRKKRDYRLFSIVQKKNLKFSDFIKNHYFYPYINYININNKYCDFIIRFEYLYHDFSRVLNILNLPQLETIPTVGSSTTKREKNYLKYYKDLDKETLKFIIRIFGPFMVEWGYKFPKEWPIESLRSIDIVFYKLLKILYFYYFKLIKINFEIEIVDFLINLIDKFLKKE